MAFMKLKEDIKLNLLITGGAGFIGSNFIEYLLFNRDDVSIVNVDKLTYAGSLSNLTKVENHPRYRFIKGDICDRAKLEEIFVSHQISSVIHFAAESHVDESIKRPSKFVETNVMGTFNLIDVAKNMWMYQPGIYKTPFQHSRFHHISTDEVYGTLGPKGYFTEQTPYAPNSPYSASKASSDMLVRSYYHTFGMNVTTTNCSNNYGPKQHEEKLIPTVIKKALAYENIPIYGNGQNVRDWLYVEDHCRAIEKVFFEGKSGETYIVGGNNEKTNIEIAELICDVLDEKIPILYKKSRIKSYRDLIQFINDRPGHDFRYAINSSKIEENLNYYPATIFNDGIKKTIEYYMNNDFSTN